MKEKFKIIDSHAHYDDDQFNEDRESVEVANHPMEILYLKCEQPLSEFDMGRKVLTNEK